jgi:hypothetical protein
MSVIHHGLPIGEFRGKSIPAYIITSDGRRYTFRRTILGLEDEDGGLELAKLASDECVIAPGLIYRALE